MPDQSILVEGFDLLRPEALDVEGVAADEMAQALDRLRRADQRPGTAADRIHAPTGLVLAHGLRAANGTFGREPVWLRARGTVLDDDVDDLRDHVAGALDDDGVADADVLAVADRLTIIADAGDVVLVVQRRVLYDDAADCHRP